jgi:hypothetical protein
MDVWIVYESLFGNTREVAEAIAAGVRVADPEARVTLLRAEDARPGESEADLLIVGGPTHVLRMASRHTRRQGIDAGEKSAAKQHRLPQREPHAEGPGVREWLDRLPEARPGSRAAAFDTRLPSRIAGGAARPIAHALRRHGYRMAAKPEGFIVTGGEGPLRDGELDRARLWGLALVEQAAPARA